MLASRHWQHGIHDFVHQPGDVDDARAGIFLWRARWTKKCSGHHDSEFCFDGLDDSAVVLVRLSRCASAAIGTASSETSTMFVCAELGSFHSISE